ncbi:hypothetical protein GCM10027347_09030 [Larkinella harenae]
MTELMLLEKPREDQKENLNVLRFSADNLLSLINNILDFNKIEANKVSLESIPFALPKLLEDISAGFRMAAQEKGLEFTLSVDPDLNQHDVVGDPTRLTQILFNLVGNAVKFTSAGRVALSAAVIARQADSVDIRFSVKDTGIGISPEQQRTIFDPFSQASTAINRQFGGTGLGLAIVKHLLEIHQSRIQLESVPGQGSDFYFNIRYQTVPAEQTSSLSAAREFRKLTNLRVLLAEDNEMNILLMQKIFAQWAIDLTVVRDGREALAIMETTTFDVILMDIHMPELNGFETARQIRQLTDRRKATIPIIALTAAVSTDIIVQVQESGMNDYIEKPFRINDLYHKLADLLSVEQ